MRKKTDSSPNYNEVFLFEAKPNPMFPDWMTERLRFLRYARPVACACCGRKTRCHWTLLMSFKAAITEKQSFALKCEPAVHLPLTPVCRDHILEPQMPGKQKKS